MAKADGVVSPWLDKLERWKISAWHSRLLSLLSLYQQQQNMHFLC